MPASPGKTGRAGGTTRAWRGGEGLGVPRGGSWGRGPVRWGGAGREEGSERSGTAAAGGAGGRGRSVRPTARPGAVAVRGRPAPPARAARPMGAAVVSGLGGGGVATAAAGPEPVVGVRHGGAGR